MVSDCKWAVNRRFEEAQKGEKAPGIITTSNADEVEIRNKEQDGCLWYSSYKFA
jgi:hypothetical protein